MNELANAPEEQFKVFRGVVEDNNHPDKNGKVRVRVMGVHPIDLKECPTDSLPWAEVIRPLQYGSASSIGVSSVPEKGTWVFLFFDHGDENYPVVFGAIASKPTKAADTSKGFNDPEGIYPLSDRLNEWEHHRLSRVENLDKTIHKKINDDKTSASGGTVSIAELPSTNDASKYPEVDVIETSAGHHIELDNTSGNERIRIYHKTGSYFEIKPDGTIAIKSQKDEYNIIKGNLNEIIQQSVQTYISQNLDIFVGGNDTQTIGGNLKINVSGNVDLTAGGNVTVKGATINLN